MAHLETDWPVELGERPGMRSARGRESESAGELNPFRPSARLRAAPA